MNNITFSIEQARNYSGLTQVEMAKKLGISVGRYGQIENGTNYFRMDEAHHFSEITGIPMQNIIFFGQKVQKICSR